MHFRFQRCLPSHGIDWLRFIYGLSATLRVLWTFNWIIWLAVVLRCHEDLHQVVDNYFAMPRKQFSNSFDFSGDDLIQKPHRKALVREKIFYERKLQPKNNFKTRHGGPKISNEEFVIKNDKFRVFAFGTCCKRRLYLMSRGTCFGARNFDDDWWGRHDTSFLCQQWNHGSRHSTIRR